MLCKNIVSELFILAKNRKLHEIDLLKLIEGIVLPRGILAGRIFCRRCATGRAQWGKIDGSNNIFLRVFPHLHPIVLDSYLSGRLLRLNRL